MTSRPKFIRTWHGWGDTLYQRPIIKALLKKHSSLVVETPIPQFFQDLPVQFSRPNDNFHTQALLVKSLNRSSFPWVDQPQTLPIQLCHFQRDFEDGLTVFEALERSGGVEVEDFDLRLDLKDEWKIAAVDVQMKINKPFVIIKPLTVRKEWLNPARNCENESIRSIIEVCKSNGIVTVGCGFHSDSESLVDESLRFDIDYTDGQLDFFTWMALGNLALATVGGVGNLLPVGMVTSAKTFVISGGYQDPLLLVDKRFGKISNTPIGFKFGPNIEVVTPFEPCNCFNHYHDCEKRIDQERLRNRFRAFINVG